MIWVVICALRSDWPALGVLLVLEHLDQLRVGEVGVALGAGTDKFELLVVGRVDRGSGTVGVAAQVEGLVLFPADVVHRAESLGAPGTLGEVA